MGVQPLRDPPVGVVTPQRQPTLDEGLDYSMDTDPSGSTAGVMPPQETAPDRQASENADPFQLELEAAEERRCQRRARELKAQQDKARFICGLTASY